MEIQAFALGLRAHKCGDVARHRDGIKHHRLKRKFAGLHLGEVEDVVDDGEQRIAGVADAEGKLHLLRGQSGLDQQVDETQNAVHRRADFVAHVGNEFALRLAGGGCLNRKLLGGLNGNLKVAVGRDELIAAAALIDGQSNVGGQGSEHGDFRVAERSR